MVVQQVLQQQHGNQAVPVLLGMPSSSVLALKWALALMILLAVALSNDCSVLQESSIAAAAAVAAKQISEGVAANGLVKTESGRSPVSERAKPR